MASSVDIFVSPTNARRPVTISYSTAPEREDVRSRISRPPFRLFRRHVSDRSRMVLSSVCGRPGPSVSVVPCLRRSAQRESPRSTSRRRSRELCRSRLADHDVCRLDVAMHDSGSVSACKGIGDLPPHTSRRHQSFSARHARSGGPGIGRRVPMAMIPPESAQCHRS